MPEKTLWIVVNRKSGEFVRRLGIHGTKKAAQLMLDQYLDAFDVDLTGNFEVRQQDHLSGDESD